MLESCAFDGILDLDFINYVISVIDFAHGILILNKQNKKIRYKIICGYNINNNSIPAGTILTQNTRPTFKDSVTNILSKQMIKRKQFSQSKEKQEKSDKILKGNESKIITEILKESNSLKQKDDSHSRQSERNIDNKTMISN